MFSNSQLVDYIQISPNKDVNRKYPITRITIHCVVGQVSVERLGAIFAPTSKEASSNYGIGYDGKVGMYVQEKDRSWCSSSADNDNRAVTIECASDTTYPYAVYDVVFNKLLDLVEDICRRNGKSRLVWFENKEQALSYKPTDEEMVMTVHRWFANKSCPGEYLYSRHQLIRDTVNKRLLNDPPKPITPTTDEEVCEVQVPVLRKGMTSGYVKTAQILLNKYNNAKLDEDGAFGKLTENAVIKYQKSRKLDVDGVIGTQTWNQLLK